MKVVKTEVIQITNSISLKENLIIAYHDGVYVVTNEDFTTNYTGEEMKEIYDVTDEDLMEIRVILKNREIEK